MDGSLPQVQSKRSSETYRNFANGFIYSAAGAVTAMRLGNGKWENTVFNSRMQPTQIGLGNGVNSQNLLKLDYEYGATASVNNGNVTKQTNTLPGVANPFVQTYSYDELNRLTNAEEIKNSVQQWEQTFTYDRFGNRNYDQANTTTLVKNCGSSPNFEVCSADVPIVNPSVNTANNKLTGTTYDAAGNVIEDAEGREFTYDAENKQVEVENGSSQLIGQYYFDGDGKRVKKVVPNGETTVFVYDASGRLIGEYSTEVQPSQDAKTQYLTADHLGTPRINTNGVGTVVSRSDYMPYGEEITTGRSSGQGYVADDVRQGFTGYEKDDETGLDFAQARMLSRTLGRFTTTDPILMKKNRTLDPQRMNLYVYVRNRPLVFSDPYGEDLELGGKVEDEARRRLALLRSGLREKDRDKVSFFVGDGKNGYAKGKFYALVDADHQSTSGNFLAVQRIANDRTEVTRLFMGGNQDGIPNVSFAETNSSGRVVLVTDNASFGQDMYVSGKDDPGIAGMTFYGTNKPLVEGRGYVQGRDNVVAVAKDMNEQMQIETMYHEFRAHLVLSDFGKQTTVGDHPRSGPSGNAADRAGQEAEQEVRQNMLSGLPRVPAGSSCARLP